MSDPVPPWTPYINDGINYYLPKTCQIINILSMPGDPLITLIQTSVTNNYFVGEIVRLTIPKEYGIQQLNNYVGRIKTLAAVDTFGIDLDIRVGFDAFVLPIAPLEVAQVIPIGESNSQLDCATKNILLDGHR